MLHDSLSVMHGRCFLCDSHIVDRERQRGGVWDLRGFLPMNPILQFVLVSSSVLLLVQCNESRRAAADVQGDIASAGDVSFARESFESLARGDSSVASKIDWPVFTAMGENVGATYVALTSELEKQKLVSGFITQFATSFRENGGTTDGFTNWRVTFHDPQKTEVVADSANGALTLVVSTRDKMEKVSSINVVK